MQHALCRLHSNIKIIKYSSNTLLQYWKCLLKASTLNLQSYIYYFRVKSMFQTWDSFDGLELVSAIAKIWKNSRKISYLPGYKPHPDISRSPIFELMKTKKDSVSTLKPSKPWNLLRWSSNSCKNRQSSRELRLVYTRRVKLSWWTSTRMKIENGP